MQDNARISLIRPHRIISLLNNDEIVIVTGFQGCNKGDTTVLGRGGSDASAVALAVALGAQRCTIYTDVPGECTVDPKLIEECFLLPELSYDEMIELALSGAQVLMSRAVEIARQNNIEIIVGSTFDDFAHTVITSRDKIMEKRKVSGIALKKDVAIIEIKGIDPGKKVIGSILSKISDIPILNFYTNGDEYGYSSIFLAIHSNNALQINSILSNCRKEELIRSFQITEDVSQISIIGYGIQENLAIQSLISEILLNSHIDIFHLNHSGLKISIIITKKDARQSVQILHEAFRTNNLLDGIARHTLDTNKEFPKNEHETVHEL